MTKKTPDELKAAVIEQGIKLAGEMHPNTTAAQRERIGVALWATMSDFTKGIETLALSTECNRHTLEFDIVGKNPHLVRDVPSKKSALAFKLAELEQQTETPADGVTRLNLSRQIGKLSDDQLLELVPHDWKAPTVEDTPAAPAAKKLTNGDAEISDSEVGRIVSKPEHLVLASDRRRVMEHKTYKTDATKQNERDNDHLSRVSRELGRELTPTEKLTFARLNKKAS